jgi:hypothetical protein
MLHDATPDGWLHVSPPPGPPIGWPLASTTSTRQWSPSSTAVLGSSPPESCASPNRQLENATTSVPGGASKIQLPLVSHLATVPSTVRERATRPLAQLPSPSYHPLTCAAYWGSNDVAAYLRLWLTPRAPGALQLTTS